MISWTKAMFGRKCKHCEGYKPLFTHYCNDCWDAYHSYE